jgi:hypothetical protein
MKMNEIGVRGGSPQKLILHQYLLMAGQNLPIYLEIGKFNLFGNDIFKV